MPDKPDTSDISVKVVLLGDAESGKTAFLSRIIRENFNSVYKATIGAEYSTKHVQAGKSPCYKLFIWDTGGREQYRELIKEYIRGAGIVLLFVGVKGNVDTQLENLKKWKSLAEDQGYSGRFGLVFTHADADSFMPYEDRKRFATQLGITSSLGFSAKENIGWAVSEFLIGLVPGLVPKVSDPLLDSVINKLNDRVTQYERHLAKAGLRAKAGSHNEQLLAEKKELVKVLKDDIARAQAAETPEAKYDVLKQFEKHCIDQARTLNARRDPFAGMTRAGLITFAIILGIATLGFGLLAAMGISKGFTNRAYFWRTTGENLLGQKEVSAIMEPIKKPKK